MIAEGFEYKVVKGYLNQIAPLCLDLKKQGYSIVKIKVKRSWPFFWRFVYKVKMKRDFIIDFDSGEILLTPIHYDKN